LLSVKCASCLYCSCGKLLAAGCTSLVLGGGRVKGCAAGLL
jgi:hypothetical protein